MKFRLRTALGNSKRTYTHTTETPIHGTGQGSCASPAIWLLISSILMDCLSEICGGMTMQDIFYFVSQTRILVHLLALTC